MSVGVSNAPCIFQPTDAWSPGGLAAVSKIVDANNTVVFPTDITQMRSLFHARYVFRRCTKYFSKIARPLNSFLPKEKKLDWSNPTTYALSSFTTLKSRWPEPPVLALPQERRPYMGDTDACACALGAVLHQQEVKSS